ncbi:MAG TPA: IPT/TIG domain-containing protein [Pyrinomonadaceae bacterium]|nr:IPT/TIG domain-containing protein [Pyrinomonadaceae bacterium]
MQLTDINNPGERKKLFLAGGLGLLALILLWWTFIGFGSSTPTPRPAATVQVTPRPAPPSAQSPASALPVEPSENLHPLNYPVSIPAVAEPQRNIFIFYEPPPPPVKEAPLPTPPPPPPLLLANVSPGNVYARTADFTLEVSGDKFTPQVRIYVDNTELATRYHSPQQVSATVPASMISGPGTRQISVKTPDGTLHSNPGALNVAAPPTPNYSYIGIIGDRRYIDIAILQDKNNRELLNVQRGDLIGGRFRVTSISEKEIVTTDTTLKIKHTIPFTTQGDRGNPMQRPTPRIESEDDEP